MNQPNPRSDGRSPTRATPQQPTDEASLYRPEALRAHREGRRRSRHNRWLEDAENAPGADGLAFYGLLALAVIALVAAAALPVETQITGEATLLQAPFPRSPLVDGDLGASGYAIRATFRADGSVRPAPGELLLFESTELPTLRIEAPMTAVQIEETAEGQPTFQVEAALEARPAIPENAGPETIRGTASFRIRHSSLFAKLAPASATGTNGASR